MRRSLATRSATLLATTALTAILAMNTLPASAQLAWDGINTTSGAEGGAGTWSAGSATNWVDANGNNVAWINGSHAVFGDFHGCFRRSAGRGKCGGEFSDLQPHQLSRL